MPLEARTVLASYLGLLRRQGVREVALSAQARAGLNELARQAKGGSGPAVSAPRPPAAPATPSVKKPALAKPTAPTNPPLAKTAPASPKPTEPAFEIIGESKAEKLRHLAERVAECFKCENLSAARIQTVFGVGDPDAQLMFVGEAPGQEEDRQGEPFVGPAGQLLTKMIGAMGLARERVYIANILKCRPDAPVGNRKPTTNEMETCLPYLKAQIDVVGPKVLVALGSTAIEGLLGLRGIRKLRGRWQEYRGIPLMPTFHPSYLLRDRGEFAEKRKTWEDMLAVMEKLGMPVSDKQRGFFLPKK
ncbi:MAG: uracil-DNA glycosylase [Verrucomicrobiota bacterium]